MGYGEDSQPCRSDLKICTNSILKPNLARLIFLSLHVLSLAYSTRRQSKAPSDRPCEVSMQCEARRPDSMRLLRLASLGLLDRTGSAQFDALFDDLG